MTDPLEVKSTGAIADELTVAIIKLEHGIDVGDRIIRFKKILNDRVKSLSGLKEFADLLASLENTNRECWEAQDAVMGSDDVSIVFLNAKRAQTLNAQRNKLIREMDAITNELDRSHLKKNYG